MGTSHSFLEFQSKIEGAAKNLRAAEKPAVIAGGLVAARIFTVTKDAMGAGGPRGATVTNKPTSSNGHPGQLVKFGPSPGWVAILNSKTKPHDIYPRSFVGTRGKGVRARRGAGLMAVFGLNAHSGGAVAFGSTVRAHVHHPGTRGKHFVEAAQKLAPKPAAVEMQKVVLKEFGKSFL